MYIIDLSLTHITFARFNMIKNISNFRDIGRLKNVQLLATAVQLGFGIIEKVKERKIKSTQ